MMPGKSTMARLFLFILGLTAMATQVVMIREALTLFNGNELIIGLFLGLWMILTALGSFLGAKVLTVTGYGLRIPEKSPTIDNRQSTTDSFKPPLPRLPAPLLLLLSIIPLPTLFALSLLRFMIIPAGIMAGLGQTTMVLFLALLPFCLLSGMLFPLLVKNLSSIKEKNLLHEAYALDSAGSILGALLFSLVFIFILGPVESVIVLAIVGLIVVVLWGWIDSHWSLVISALAIGVFVIAVFMIIDLPGKYDQHLFFGQEIVEVKSSPYGKLSVTQIGEELNFYENGVPQATGEDPVLREESVHYGMLLHPGSKSVLLISGGIGGAINEILKYPVEKLAYIEVNPWLMRLVNKYQAFPEVERVNYIFNDPRTFLLKNSEKYDVILLNTPDPSSVELNRFYTSEFFDLLKNRLNPGGILSLSVPAAGNYMNESSRMMHSVYYNTLQKVFSHIRIIPGGKDYFIASDTPLDQSFLLNYQARGLDNTYVNPSYINEDLQKLRANQIMMDILAETDINSDTKPYIFSSFLKHWLSRFRVDYRIIPSIIAVFLVIVFIFLGPVNLGVFTSGFTSAALEFLLLIWFQVIFGFIYQMTGLIFAVFMAGMATGSFFRYKIIKSSTFASFLGLQGAMALLSVFVATIFLLFSSSPFLHFSSAPLLPLSSSLTQYSLMLLIMVMVFTTGLLMGMQFSLSAKLRKSDIIKSSGESFSADLLGSAFGILLASVYFVPQFGLIVTGFILAGLNVLAVGVMAVRR